MNVLTFPRPGQPWPEQNAHFAALVTAPHATWALLLPTDVPALPSQPWGRYGQDIPGADSVIDGHANTLAMAEAGNELALAVRALPGDCYLPSPLEALMLFATLREQVGAGWAWTSRQYSARHAWCQSFYYGSQDWGVKDGQYRAVPVRRLILRSFDPSLNDDAAQEAAEVVA